MKNEGTVLMKTETALMTVIEKTILTEVSEETDASVFLWNQ